MINNQCSQNSESGAVPAITLLPATDASIFQTLKNLINPNLKR